MSRPCSADVRVLLDIWPRNQRAHWYRCYRFAHVASHLSFATAARHDAREECRAQLETALRWGIDVTNLDTHMHVLQGRSDLYEIYLDLATEFRLPVRMSSQQTTDVQQFQARERAGARGLLFNEHVIYCPWGRPTRDVFFEEIPKLLPGMSEIFAHPVLDGEELRAYDSLNPISGRTTPCALRNPRSRTF